MATNAKRRHQQDLRGLEKGSWRREWVDEEIVIDLPLRGEDRKNSSSKHPTNIIKALKEQKC